MIHNTQKMLNGVEVKPRRLACTHAQRNALQPNCVPITEMTLTTTHGLGRNGTSNNRTLNCRDSDVFSCVSSRES